MIQLPETNLPLQDSFLTIEEQEWLESRIGFITASRYGEAFQTADGNKKYYEVDEIFKIWKEGLPDLTEWDVSQLYESAKKYGKEHGIKMCETRGGKQRIHIDYITMEYQYTPETFGTSCLKLIDEIRAERKTKQPSKPPSFARSMEYGKEMEEEAFTYMAEKNPEWIVIPNGLNFIPYNDFTGATPDCFISTDGEDLDVVWQLKTNWNSGEFESFIQTGEIKREYYDQMKGDFMAANMKHPTIKRVLYSQFDPRRPDGEKMAIKWLKYTVDEIGRAVNRLNAVNNMINETKLAEKITIL